MRAHTRFGVSICLTVFSLVTITFLLPNSRVGTQLQRIALVAPIDGLWNWVSDNGGLREGIEVRVVVFGDSWVDDTVKSGEEGKGKSWTEVLYDELNGTTYLNFAVSQPSQAFPKLPPSGAMISNDIYTSSVTTFSPSNSPMSLLPDLAAQIEEFLKLQPSVSHSEETIFVVSFGIWDIYHFAGLDFNLGKNTTSNAVSKLFSNLDRLHSHYIGNQKSRLSNAGNSTGNESPTFRVIIPKLFEPTLLPGWTTQRPVPLPPSSVAEQQKNALYLTNLWNSKLENKIGEWLQDVKSHSTPSEKEGNETNTSPEPVLSRATRNIFYYDLPRYILNTLVEHHLEEERISDASGLGKGESPFESISVPCLRDGEAGEQDGSIDQNGRVVCKEPNEHLFWDYFELGAVANEAIGKEVGQMVWEGKTMKKASPRSPVERPTRLVV